jgi:hypothetical protein
MADLLTEKLSEEEFHTLREMLEFRYQLLLQALETYLPKPVVSRTKTPSKLKIG